MQPILPNSILSHGNPKPETFNLCEYCRAGSRSLLCPLVPSVQVSLSRFKGVDRAPWSAIGNTIAGA